MPRGGYSSKANLYVYALNDPLNRIDPFGMASDSSGYGGYSTGTIIGAAFLGIAAVVGAVALAPELAAVGALEVGAEAAAEVGAEAAAEGAESGLAFSQTTASPYFSSQGTFSGQSIADVAGQLRSGSLAASEVPVQTVDVGSGNFIVNTRSALSLMQGGIPQTDWNIISMIGDADTEANIIQRLINNGLTNSGTDVLRITGSGPNASTLIP
jgi:hypothetical protein